MMIGSAIPAGLIPGLAALVMAGEALGRNRRTGRAGLAVHQGPAGRSDLAVHQGPAGRSAIRSSSPRRCASSPT